MVTGMPRESSELERALGRLLTAIQREETGALDRSEWRMAHAALGRAENLYWAAKRASLAAALGTATLREYLGVEWLSRHPRVLPAIQDLEAHSEYFARQA
jgi:hypothetical protein